ncbi:hypothetical protein CANCADRAFT_16630, partial [Tortispora caseinolytica NRRL Y-17796]
SINAGTSPIGHYRDNMSPMRYAIRSKILPLIRKETPILARIQSSMRSNYLDWFFSMLANFGTHTFYLLFLPILFWFGRDIEARGLVYVLGFGVYATGFAKDYLALPRPMSPPLHRLSMSPDVNLEYGCPSTHSANSISVALWVCSVIPHSPSNKYAYVAAAIYTFAQSFGRIYCGMHGFVDVFFGLFIGYSVWALVYYALPLWDQFLANPSYLVPLACVVLIALLLYACPDPVDNCPCFDDSVAFLGVILGLTIIKGTIPFSTAGLSSFNIALFSLLRVLTGVTAVVAWRIVSKPLLFRYLPPIYRFVQGRFRALNLPRNYFLPASAYKIPANADDPIVVRPTKRIPEMIQNIRHRGRGASIGPQSQIDAYEAIANQHEARDMSPEELKVLSNVPERPLHYDVEVIARTLVYAGISLVSV